MTFFVVRKIICIIWRINNIPWTCNWRKRIFWNCKFCLVVFFKPIVFSFVFKRRNLGNIHWFEYTFLFLGILAALITDGLTIVRLVSLESLKEPEFAYGILIIVNSGRKKNDLVFIDLVCLFNSFFIIFFNDWFTLSTNNGYCCIYNLLDFVNYLCYSTLFYSKKWTW